MCFVCLAGSLYLHDWEVSGLSREAYKTQTVARLKERFPNIVAGAGDKEYDAAAFSRNGLRTYLFSNQARGARTVYSWREILKHEQKHGSSED